MMAAGVQRRDGYGSEDRGADRLCDCGTQCHTGGVQRTGFKGIFPGSADPFAGGDTGPDPADPDGAATGDCSQGRDRLCGGTGYHCHRPAYSGTCAENRRSYSGGKHHQPAGRGSPWSGGRRAARVAHPPAGGSTTGDGMVPAGIRIYPSECDFDAVAADQSALGGPGKFFLTN